MATFRIQCLVPKTNMSGVTSWFWQPSAALKRAGWESMPLGQGGRPGEPPDAIADQARAQNRKVAEAREAGTTLRQVRRLARPLTLGEAIDRYEAAGYPSVKKPGATVAAATRRQYKSKFVTLRAWAENGRTPCVAITSQRVAVLRDALLKPAKSGPRTGEVRLTSAHETLRVGRTLFTWLEQQHLRPKGSNPFEDFGLAMPDPRDHIWWPPAREAVMAAAIGRPRAGLAGGGAEQRTFPNLALAIDLAFQIGQREADLLRTSITQYQPIPAYKMDPEVFAALAAVPVLGSAPGDVWGIRIRQAKGKRWVEVPVVGDTRERVEAQIAAAKRLGLTLLLYDESAGVPWTAHKRAPKRKVKPGNPQPKPEEAGQRRFIRAFGELRAAAIATARAAGDADLAAELEQLQYRDFRRTAVVHLGELGLADQLIAAITGHSLDETKKILETYMPRTTGMAARAIALSHARGSPQSGTLRRKGETG